MGAPATAGTSRLIRLPTSRQPRFGCCSALPLLSPRALSRSHKGHKWSARGDGAPHCRAIEKHARGDVDALARDGSHSSAAAATFKQFSPHAVEHVVLLPCSLLW